MVEVMTAKLSELQKYKREPKDPTPEGRVYNLLMNSAKRPTDIASALGMDAIRVLAILRSGVNFGLFQRDEVAGYQWYRLKL